MFGPIQFAQAWALGLLVFAIAPLALFLWRQSPKIRVRWGAGRYLRQAVEKQKKTSQFYQWLQLALRAASLVLFSVGLSEPMVRFAESVRESAEPAHFIVILDASASMKRVVQRNGQAPRKESCFEFAKRQLGDWVNQQSSDARFSLALSSGEPRPLGVAGQTKDEMLKAIATATCDDGHGNLKASLEWASSLARVSKATPRIVVVTDLQWREWQDLLADEKIAENGPRLTAPIAVVDVGGVEATAVAIDRIELAPQCPAPGETFVARIHVKRGSNAASTSDSLSSFEVDLRLGGEMAGREGVTLGENEDRFVEISATAPQSELFAIEASMATEAPDADDRFFAVARTRRTQSVLVAEGAPGEGDFIVEALTLERGKRFEIERVAAGQLGEWDFNQYDLLILCNVAPLERALADRLEGYVRAGGSVITFGGDQCVSSENGTIEPKFGDWFSGPSDWGSYPVRTIGSNHPVLHAFQGDAAASLEATPLWRYSRIRPPHRSDRAETILATDADDPLLVASTLGRGRLLLCGIRVGLETDESQGSPWSLLATWPSFVPLLRDGLDWAIGGENTLCHIDCGTEGIGLVSIAAVAETTAKPMVFPTIPGERWSEGRQSRWAFRAVDQAGFYRLQSRGEDADGLASFYGIAAVHAPSDESDPTNMDERALPTWAKVLSFDSLLSSTPSGTFALDQYRSLDVLALGLALLALSAEAYVSWKIAKGNRGADSIWFLPCLRLARLVAWVMLLAAMLEWSWTRFATSPVPIVCAIDNSQSMGIADIDGERRVDVAADTLRDLEDASRTASAKIDWRPVWIGGTKGDPPSLREIQLDTTGAESRLGDELADVLAKSASTETGVVVISDGVVTSGRTLEEVAPLFANRSLPVVTILHGDENGPDELRIERVRHETTVFAGDRLTFDADIRGRSKTGQSYDLSLFRDDSLEPLMETPLAPIEKDRVTARLTDRATSVGEHSYRIELRNAQGTISQKLAMVKVIEPKLRVLLIASTPNYEFRYLKNLLERSTRTGPLGTGKLDVWLQDADPRFADEDVSALSRLLSSKEDFASYDVMVLCDADLQRLGSTATQSIRDAVRLGGKSLVFLPGAMNRSSQMTDSISDLVPEWTEQIAMSGETPMMLRSALGRESSWLELADTKAENDLVWESRLAAPLRVFGQRRSPLDALAFFETRRAGQRNESLVLGSLHFRGKGRVWFQGFETYRWRMREGGKYFERYWTQLLRFLAKNAQDASQWELSSVVEPNRNGASVLLRVNAPQGTVGEFNDSLSVSITKQGSAPIRTRLRRTTGPAWVSEVRGLEEGEYEWRVESETLSNFANTFRVEPFAPEMKRLGADSVAMRQLAEMSGGAFLDASQKPDLRNVIDRFVARAPRIAIPLWNPRGPMMATLFLALVLIEWLMRKRAALDA